MRNTVHGGRRLNPAMMLLAAATLAVLGPPSGGAVLGQEATSETGRVSDRPFAPADVFRLDWADDPRISPDGRTIVYVRNRFDIMTDRTRTELWTVGADGRRHRPLVTEGDPSSPRWSPDGSRLAYLAEVDGEEGARRVLVRWLEAGQTAPVVRTEETPRQLTWSPDGRWLAFAAFVPAETKPFAAAPARPEGAEWADPPRVYEDVLYRADGRGYLEPGHVHLFVVAAEGGAPRQLTSGPYDHDGGFDWTPDSAALIVSVNRREDAALQPLDTDLWEVRVPDGALRRLTDRRGPVAAPVVSPDGRRIAWVGFEDRYQGYQVRRLHVMERGDGNDSRAVSPDLDRSVSNPVWAADGGGLFVQFDDQGSTKVAHVSLDGRVRELTSDLGGTSLGRPYSGGSFTVSRDGRFAYTAASPSRPAQVAVGDGRSEPRRVTALSDVLLADRALGEVEEIWYESSYDGRRIHGWIVKPPGFDESRRYPLLLEIHGGPFANYGPRFAAEMQLYAAAGYVVLYTNPRGSTSYGEEFGNLIHHAYPGHDYDDLMSGVDAVLARGYVDEDSLFVTGGSGGGVLSAWIIGNTDRFRAAAVQKPVINWYSWVLTADMYPYGARYWFPGPPWEHAEHYMARSPISRVGDVTTPTLLITGEQDYRTPIGESEQYYQALKLRGVPAALVRVPGAPHGIARRPSHLIAKVNHVLAWFDRYRGAE